MLRTILLGLVLWVAWGASILLPTYSRVDIAIGEASPRDIRAPHQITYISEVKTEEARRDAGARVAEVFVGPDLQIATEQMQALQDTISEIGLIRERVPAPGGASLDRLLSLSGIEIPQGTFEMILEMDDLRWEMLADESLRLLNLIMRDELRTGDISRAARDVPRLMLPTLSAREREIVNDLVIGFVVPNTFLDIERTQERRAEASAAVTPVVRTIRSGESIVREGEIVTEFSYEKLQVLGLLEHGPGWQQIAAEMLFGLVIIVVGIAYTARVYPLLMGRPRRQMLLVVTFMAVALSARALIPGHTLLPYLFPGAAAAMLVVLFMNIQYATIMAFAVGLSVGVAAGGSLELTIYIILGGLVGALALMHTEQLSAFVPATGYLAAVNVATLLLFRISSTHYDTMALVQLAGVGVLNAVISSSLCFVAYAFTGRFFGITTALHLMELARPTHPLFRELLIKAPGTYHHSILISNMAERAAEAIGADALLTRVGSYYHDIGKLSRPYFYTENQTEDQNPHDKLDPRTSAEIIISHTQEGLELARRYRLPDKVRAFIPEHHGTTLMSYFYRKATQTDDDVEEDSFRYPGPKPQSKETAIVMLADAVEAWSRANRPATQAEMERVIRQVINDRLISGQLDETDLTLKDLEAIRKAFASVLRGVYHPRVQYPERTAYRKASASKSSD